MLRMIASRSVSRAVRGINSPMLVPGTTVSMGLNSPRTSAGASGLGSQVECCGGPPMRKRMMQDRALPVWAAAGAACRSASDKPNRPSPPARITSRRESPSHRRTPLSRMESMAKNRYLYLLLDLTLRVSVSQVAKRRTTRLFFPLEHRLHAPLHLVRRHVFLVRGHPPKMSERVFELAGPVAVELI